MDSTQRSGISARVLLLRKSRHFSWKFFINKITDKINYKNTNNPSFFLCLLSCFLFLLCVSVCPTFGQKESSSSSSGGGIQNISASIKNYSYLIESLDQLAYSDLLIVKKLLEIRETSPTKLIDKYLQDFERGSELALTSTYAVENKIIPAKEDWLSELWLMKQAEKISNNAISAYKLVIRTARIWPKLYGTIISEIDWPLLNLARQDWPTEADVISASNGIFDLHIYYKFNLNEFTEGKIFGVSTGVTLDHNHCLNLGVVAHHLGYYAQAVEWLELAREKLTMRQLTNIAIQPTEWEKKTLDKIERLIRKAVKAHDETLSEELEEGILWNPKLFYELLKEQDDEIEGVDIFGEDVMFKKSRVRRRLTVDDLEAHAQQEYSKDEHDQYRHFELCQGANFQTEEQKSLLFCWYESQVNKYYWIGPIKMEFISQDPDIVQIYEVVGNSTIEKIKNLAQGTYTADSCDSCADILTPRNPVIQERYKGFQSAYATSLNDYMAPSLGLHPHLTKIEAFSGFKTRSLSAADNLRVSSYTFAGNDRIHHDKHSDAWSEDPETFRLATLRFFLSDVEAGGLEVFPRLGISVKPVKGSALLWFNMYGNLFSDFDVVHGSCAPILGRKYVATKWIRKLDQFLSYPCPLNPWLRFSAKVQNLFISDAFLI